MSPPAQAPTLSDGRYTLTRRLGEGGMATVFLAWDNKLKVWRAVKVLLPTFVRKRKLRKRFENEAHAMARLEHTNIVRIYDVGLEGNVPYMVMELAEGGCIIDWLARFGPMPPRLAVDVTVQVCKGIRAAHEAGIVHRDIKPHNVLVNRKGSCKVTDFGIAQMDSESLTKTGSVMGTWGYMAPEQRTDAKNVDAKADVFSIGAMLYSLLTNTTPTELYVADEDDPIFDGIPPELLEVIIKACSYKPGERYEDVRTLGMIVHKAGSTQPKVPPSTPSLVLSSEPLPESIESAMLSGTIVDELQEALGSQHTTMPEDEHPPAKPAPQTSGPPTPERRVLPYYMPSEPVTKPPTSPREPVSGAPSYIDADVLEQHERAEHELRPLPKDPMASEPKKQAETQAAPKGSPLEALAKVVALGAIVVMLLATGLLGWGMVQVNGAHDAAMTQANQLSRQIEQTGPVVDALAQGGADRQALETLYFAHEEASPGARGEAARAYVDAIEQASATLSPEGTSSLGATLKTIYRSRDDYAHARGEWADAASGFPGVLAVSIGLASAP